MIVRAVMKSRRKFPPSISTSNSNEVRIEKGFAEIYVDGKRRYKCNLKEWKIVIER